MDPEILHMLRIGSYFTYLTATLFLGTGVAFDFLHVRQDRPTPVMRMAGAAVLSASLANSSYIALGVLFGRGNTYLEGICMCMDMLTVLCIGLVGMAIMRRDYPTVRQFHLAGFPFYLILVLQIMAGRHTGKIFPTLGLALSVGFLIYTNIMLRRYELTLKEKYSTFEGKDFGWFFGFCMMALLGSTLYSLSMLVFPKSYVMKITYDLVLTIMWFVFIRWVMKHENAVAEAEAGGEEFVAPPTEVITDIVEETSPTMPVIITSSYDTMKAELDKLMRVDKLYLDPNLVSETLIKKLGTNRARLTDMIHNEMNTSFCDYINGFRIIDAMAMLKDPENRIEDIAIKCGFNSSRSFIRVFKNTTDCTPTEWRKKNINANK